MNRALASLLGVLSAGGCTTLIDVDEYHFDIDPCAPRRDVCEGGSSFAYVAVDADVTRRDAENHLDGFNFDGTDLAICGQRDYVSPSGEAGIDNQLAPLIESYEGITGINVRTLTRERLLRGEGLQLYTLGGVDDFTNDDCVSLEIRVGVVPEGTVLDANGDGELDAGLRLDYLVPNHEDSNACIIDGVLHARFPEGNSGLPFGTGEFTNSHGRMRAAITADEVTVGLFGGTADIADVRTALSDIAQLVAIVEHQADIHPTTEGTGDCIAVSWALTFRAVRAELGSLVSP